MEKKTTKAFGKEIYLLGRDAEGINYYLEEPSWDCGWYWGFGYIETYTNNRSPANSKDIMSHQHFDTLFLSGPENGYDEFKKFFKETPLSNDEIWELVDLMQTYYTLKKTAAMLSCGYSHYTEKAKIDDLKDPETEKLINKTFLPLVFERIKKIFTE